MTKAETARVVNATVRLDGKGGQGVLVTGGFILTATHCIKWSGDGGMAMGDYYIENVTTKDGARLRVGPLAADPVSDITLLGSLDDQVFFDDCASRVRNPLRVHILTHKGKWIEATIIRYGTPGHLGSGCLCIEADDRVEGGTSGGPVVDSTGRLVGVVSHFIEVETGQKCVGALPIAHLALPRWAWLLDPKNFCDVL